MATVYFGTVRSRTAILVDAIQLPKGRTHAQIKAEKRTLKAKKPPGRKRRLHSIPGLEILQLVSIGEYMFIRMFAEYYTTFSRIFIPCVFIRQLTVDCISNYA